MRLGAVGGQSSPRSMLTIIIIAIVALAAVLGVLAFLSSKGSNNNTTCSVIDTSQNAPGIANSSSASSTVSFTIIESDPGNNYEGMNGSAFHLSTPWPVIQVYQGQTVVIHIYNCASSESHGFAIAHYFNSGATIRPGQSYTLTFVANQAGSFRAFCSIFCAIHPYMQNGELIVTPT